MGEPFRLSEVVDLHTYPISGPVSPALNGRLHRIRADLGRDGCSVLPGFIRADALDRLQRESATVAPFAYRTVETVNAYNIPLDTPLSEDHPGRVRFERGNAFVARDQIPADHIIHELYVSPAFQAFMAAAFDVPAVFPMTDPLAGLVLNVLEPGREHPWHFDTNAFTVSLMTQGADEGGAFEYCPGIRAPGDENLAAVRRVVGGEGRELIRALDLRPGDLQLFKGRFSLHRVAPVGGGRERHTAIFAYCEQPGVVGTPARTRQLFGRILPAHGDAERRARRADALLD